MKALIPQKIIEKRIFMIRGHRVMLDRDLAQLYGVKTGNLNKAVDRNINRFPVDFMFRLTQVEFKNLIFHFGTSSWGGTRKMPRAFTEQGAAMLSSVLKSKRAIYVNIAITLPGQSIDERASFIPIIQRFEILPIPANDYFVIRNLRLDDNTSELKIYNSIGKLMKTIELSKPETQITTTDLKSGVYFLKVNSQTRKLIIHQEKD